MHFHFPSLQIKSKLYWPTAAIPMTKNTIPDLQWSLNYVLLRIHIYVICSIVLQWGIYIVCLVRSSLKCSVIQYIHCILYSWQAGKATFWFSFVPELGMHPCNSVHCSTITLYNSCNTKQYHVFVSYYWLYSLFLYFPTLATTFSHVMTMDFPFRIMKGWPICQNLQGLGIFQATWKVMGSK